MNRRQFIIQTSSALAMQPARKPNVLFLMPDQWRAQNIPSSGDRQVIAPNLERLAREGVYFDRAYTSYAVCAPSRAAILTGKFPHACGVPRNHMQLPLDQPSLAAQLKQAGYSTGFIGKWHLDGRESPGFVPPGPRRRGFHYWAAFNVGYRYYDPIYFRDDPQPVTPKEYEPEHQTTLAMDFIRKNKQNPFYLTVAWGPPHSPLTPPPDMAKLYQSRRLAVRDNVPAANEDQAREDLAGYYALCTSIDRQIGRLLKLLDDENLAQDTIVVFTSDHGYMMYSQGLESHDEPFEEASRIPLLIRYPRVFAAGTKNDLPISNVDYMPTLLGLCGATIPDGVQGRNLAALLTTGKGERPESIFAEGKIGDPAEWRMLVRGLDKIVINRQDEVTHLFNLGQDPYEMENLAQSRVHQRTKDELMALMNEWRKRTADGRTGSGLRKRG
jgi:arylsulfatase A-like enzyme